MRLQSVLQVGTRHTTGPGEGIRVTGCPANTGVWFDVLTVRSCGCMHLYLVTALCLADFSSFWSPVCIKIARSARTSNSCRGARACTRVSVCHLCLCLVISALVGQSYRHIFAGKSVQFWISTGSLFFPFFFIDIY